MKRLIWETECGDGKTYRIEFTDYFKSGEAAQYWYRSLDGNIGQGSAQTVKPPDRDGAVTYQVTGTQREVTFEGTLIARSGDRMSEGRAYLCKCFDPRYFGVLYYYAYRGDAGKKIRCRPTVLPVFDRDGGSVAEFKIGFISDDSTWSLVPPIGTAMGMTVKNLRFGGGVFPHAMGLVFTRAVLTNATPYYMRPVVTVYGSEKAIEIRNRNTGQFLMFRQPVEYNQRIVIDTKNVRAYLEEKDEATGEWFFVENVLHRLTLASDITKFLIAPGENEFVIERHLPESSPVLVIRGDIPVMGV